MSNYPNSDEEVAANLSGGATKDEHDDVDRVEQTLHDAEGGIEGSALDAGDL